MKIKTVGGKEVEIYLKRLYTLLAPKRDVLQEILIQKMDIIKYGEGLKIADDHVKKLWRESKKNETKKSKMSNL